MSSVQQAIEVSAPLHAVYEQLATFESYPQFMTGVEQVTQISNDQTHWVMDMDGQRREFDAQITECSMDERVSWSTMDGPLLAETITLRPVGETRTQIVAQLEADVAFLMPSDRHGQESLNRRLKADLASFKRLIELDDNAASRQISGIGTISTGQANTPRAATSFGAASGAGPDPASPAGVAARARNRNMGPGSMDPGSMDPGNMGTGHTAMGGANMGGANMGGANMGGANMGGANMGGANMGGQGMSSDDAWGDGMINEEERGSAHDH